MCDSAPPTVWAEKATRVADHFVVSYKGQSWDVHNPEEVPMACGKVRRAYKAQVHHITEGNLLVYWPNKS